MANGTMDQIVASGKPFNPLSGTNGQGRAYSGQTSEKLLAAMAKHGWDDPRFLSEAQVKRLGLTLAKDAQQSVVLYRESEQDEWTRNFVYNGSQVVGLQSLADMQLEARKRLGVGLTFADHVEEGKPFNPLSGSDGQGRRYSETNLAALDAAMKEHGWSDPRFVTKAQVEHGGWSVAEDAPELNVWAKTDGEWKQVPVFNGSKVVGLPSLEVMAQDAQVALDRTKAAAAEVAKAAQEKAAGDMAQGEASAGVMMNPLAGVGGKVFSGKNADRLLGAMTANSWTDGRFLTAKQVGYAELTLVEGAQPVTTYRPTPNGFEKIDVFNAAQVVGMPTMAQMYAKVSALPSAAHAEMAMSGIPFDPLTINAERLGAVKDGLDTLMAAMKTHAWDDPRFVSAAAVKADETLSVAEGAQKVKLGKEILYNASQVEGLPKLPNLPAWQALYDQQVIAGKEQRKAQELKDGGLAPAAQGSMRQAYEDFWGKPGSSRADGAGAPEQKLAMEMLPEVLATAANASIKISPAKIEGLLSGAPVADGSYIGKVVAVDAERGLVYQSQGRGRGEVLPMGALSRPILAEEVGQKLSIVMKDGRGEVAGKEVARGAAQER